MPYFNIPILELSSAIWAKLFGSSDWSATKRLIFTVTPHSGFLTHHTDDFGMKLLNNVQFFGVLNIYSQKSTEILPSLKNPLCKAKLWQYWIKVQFPETTFINYLFFFKRENNIIIIILDCIIMITFIIILI